MSKTYEVKTYAGGATYTVTLNESGVESATELSDSAISDLKESMGRLMERYGLSAITALGRVVGSYSTVEEVGGTTITSADLATTVLE